MKILVTGGAGFIGSHLCDRLLTEGHDVVIVDKLSNETDAPIAHLKYNEHVLFHYVNIVDIDVMDKIFQQENFDAVFHLAANADIQMSSQNANVDTWDTLMTTVVILQLMRKYHVPTLLFSSSSAIYGETSELSSETSPVLPISYYGAAKAASEHYIRAAIEGGHLEQALMFRFANIIGERLTHGVIFDIRKKLKVNPEELVVLGNGEQNKPYVYVTDVVDAMIFIWKKNQETLDIYNIGVDTTTKVKDIVNIYLEEAGLTPKVTYTGGTKGWPGDAPVVNLDVSKLTKLGWVASMTSEEAVRKTVRIVL